MNGKLRWIDILVLRIIVDRVMEREGEKPPSQRELFDITKKTGLINEWLAEHGVDRLYASPITGNKTLTQTVHTLRMLRLIQPRGKYWPTSSGMNFFDDPAIGRDWERWPLAVPIIGELNMPRAIYPPKL